MDWLPKLEAQRTFFNSGATAGYAFRVGQLKRLRQALEEQEAAINAALLKDLNKTPEEIWVTEIGLVIQEINYTLKQLRLWMQPERKKTNLLNFPSSSFVYPAARGVVLVIGPWNFPLQLLLTPVVGAIAAGNCVVMKPSEHAPATAAVVAQLIKSAFPENLALVIPGEGAEIIPALMNRFRFDQVFYTGSPAVGKLIYQQAARELIPVVLELGGKDPCVVEADADLVVAARRIAVGKFTNAGQMCVCPDYLLVQESVKDKLLEQISIAIKQFYTDQPEQAYGYGRIINQKQFDRLQAYLAMGRVLQGGNSNRDQLYIEPTLLDEVPLDSPLMQEEIFGPILPVFSFKTTADALAIIARNPNPLSFYLFTASAAREKEWIGQVQFGTGCINNAAWQFSNQHLPFGGVGQSGIGAYHGKYSFDAFTHYKALLKTPTWFDPAIKYPPLKGKLKLLKWFIR